MPSRPRSSLWTLGRFEPANFMTDAQIDEWVRTTRHKVVYRDESKVD